MTRRPTKSAKQPRAQRGWQFTLMDGAGKVTGLSAGADLEYHELCLAFPPMDDAEQAALNADVKKRGVREAGWLYEGKILEGRHRFIAAKAAGKPMLFRDFIDKDPIAFVVSANMRRRHLDPGQRALVAAKLEGYKHGGARKGDKPVLTRLEAAAIMQASRETVARAKVVIDKGAPELQDAVARGDVTVRAAADVATLPPAEQSQLVARGEKEIIAAAKVIRAEKNAKRRAEKVERNITIAKGNRPLEFDRQFVVGIADPPWRYERPLIGDSDRSIENKYPTMAFAEIEAMPVHKWMAPASAIYLHIPQPLAICETPDGLCYPHQLGRAWGDPNWRDPEKRNPKLWFIPRAVGIWEKRSPTDIIKEGGPLGLGHYWRTDHECVYAMTRGGLDVPDYKPRSVYHIRSRGELEHSEKPQAIYDDLLRMYPAYAKAGLMLALFERETARPGFVCWGNQVPTAEAA